MTKTEIKWASPGEEKLLIQYEISNAALYALFDNLIMEIDKGFFDPYIIRYLKGGAAYNLFPDYLRADDFTNSGYDFWFGEFNKDHQEYIVSGIFFNRIESKRASLFSRLFYGKERMVSLKAMISMNKLGACVNLEVDYELYKDGSVKTVSGFSDLKNLYLKLKARFLEIRQTLEERRRIEEKKRSEAIAESIFEGTIELPKPQLPAQVSESEKYHQVVAKPPKTRLSVYF